MKYLKTFENNNKNVLKEIDLNINSYWMIYGNREKVIEVLDHLIKDSDNFQSIYLKKRFLNIKNLVYNNSIKDIFGIVILNSYDSLSYLKMDDETFKNEIMKHYEEFKFRGEIKLENNELIIDTLEVDANKYNL